MEKLIALNEAAEVYGVTTQTLRRWADRGRIKMVKPDGHHVHFEREELDREVPHVGRLLARIRTLEAGTSSAQAYSFLADALDSAHVD
jgi:excisionase family DNA binding protein